MARRRGRWAAALACLVVVAGLSTSHSATALGTAASHAAGLRNGRPIARVAPTVVGVPRVGDRLRLSPGRWSGANRLYVRWQRCGPRLRHCYMLTRRQRILGGRHAPTITLPLTSHDVGWRIRVRVRAINRRGSTYVFSQATDLVTAPGTTSKPPPTSTTPTPPTPTGSSYGLKVSGSKLETEAGSVVHLHGVDRSGTEYQCVHGYGIFDGPSDAASVAAMASWHINFVRIGINDLCWTGSDGVSSQYAGAAYIRAVTNYVNLLNSYGIYVEISLMWGLPGNNLPLSESGQINGPDEDHAPATWQGMAATFKNNPYVILAPWGESYVDYPCMLNGCNNQSTIQGDPGDGDGACTSCTTGGLYYYTTAGMQQAVTLMRGAGYSGPIAIPCADAANTCANPDGGGSYAGGTWLTDHPTDPDHSILAEIHLYGKNVCDTTACMSATIGPILAAGYPAILGETGETYDGSDCANTDISQFLPWMDQNGASGYAAWAWDTFGECLQLTTDYDNPAPPSGNAYAAYIKSYYESTFPADKPF